MLDDAPTQQFRRQPVAVAPGAPWSAAPGPVAPGPAAPPWRPATWGGPPSGPAPAGLGGPMPFGPYGPYGPPVARRPRWPWILGAVAAVVVVLGLLGSVLAPSTTVSGTVTFYASNSLPLGSSCYGTGLYSDLHSGQSVVVYDDAGQQVGQGVLGTGSVISSSGYASSGYGRACSFGYSISGASSSDTYRVVVGRRNGVVFSADQVDGHADISVGS
ncbi:MAG TPA: hypothetical protein VNP37_22145 [Actinomycetospora sp.]|nr:hypothetical protein [Actinomycetospora sp.]